MVHLLLCKGVTTLDRRSQIRETISASLRAERSRAGLSQSELADAVKVTQTTVSGWERGTSMIGLDKAWLVAEALGIGIDQLAGKQYPNVDNERG